MSNSGARAAVYRDSLLLLHYERHFAATDHPQAGTGLDRGQVARLLEQVRPDIVQYYAKGHAGFVPYPTIYGNQLPGLYDVHEGSGEDLLGTYREITQEMGIGFVIGYSGLIDYQAANWRPDWQRVRADQSPYPNRALCPNSGYVDELMLPQLAEILERYDPDGIWIEAGNWTVSPCYCSGCEAEYHMLHSRSTPLSPSEPFWPEWVQFHRESFQRFVSRVAFYLHDRKPDLAYAVNGGYCTHQPEPVPDGVDRLTWDLSPAFSLRQAGLEARFLDVRNLPFDLGTWSQCSARPWPQGRLPALPSYPKTFEHLAQEGAVILANGGRWSIWINPYPDDSLPESQHADAAQAAEFARERQEWCHGTKSAAYVAILHSDAAHQRAGNGLYDPGPSLDRVRGAHQALLELHHPHDVVPEDVLLRSMDRYRVIVLPEQTALPPDLDEWLAAWVDRGGRLIASGRVSPRIMEDIPTFALEEVLGVRWTGRREPEGYFLHRDLPLTVGAPVYHVTLHGAEPLLPLVGSGHERHHGESAFPAVTRNAYGEGEAYYVAADFFAAYHRCQYPGFRLLLGDILEQTLPQPPLRTTAPPTIEVTLRSKGADTILHFVNHSPGKSLAQNSAFIEAVPPSGPFSLTLMLDEKPERVRLQPGDVEPDWSWLEGALTVFVPGVHLHAALVLSRTLASDELANSLPLPT
jgi:glycosyl hydrolase family 42 (putative beta-galactosidase)/putative glycosyl hydrolase-like family 6 (GHL6) protein